jgi:hypothetical protein
MYLRLKNKNKSNHAHKHRQESIMQTMISPHVKDREQDQPQCPDDREEDRNDGRELVEPTLVSYQVASVSKPALWEKGQIEKHDGDGAAGNEEWLEAFCSNVGDVTIIPSQMNVSICNKVEGKDIHMNIHTQLFVPHAYLHILVSLVRTMRRTGQWVYL